MNDGLRLGTGDNASSSPAGFAQRNCLQEPLVLVEEIRLAGSANFERGMRVLVTDPLRYDANSANVFEHQPVLRSKIQVENGFVMCDSISDVLDMLKRV